MFKDSPTARTLLKSMFKDSPTARTLLKSMFKDSPTAGHFSNQCLKIVLLQDTSQINV